MPDAMICPRCRHPVAHGAASCPNCGARVSGGAGSDPPDPFAHSSRPAGHEPHVPGSAATMGGESIVPTLISAALFLYVGFGLGLRGLSGNALYDGSVTTFTWGARIIGIALLLVALLEYLRVPAVVLLDLLVAFLAAAGCLVVGLIWIAFGDEQGYLVLIFGAFNLYALRGAWTRFRRVR